ncbi:MAG: hypothetical protein HY918_05735 [Candidatus Doudnabacteria bacterium]|nr:hypothetical protein [Candidatus Doudnabacteria bacterium]
MAEHYKRDFPAREIKDEPEAMVFGNGFSTSGFREFSDHLEALWTHGLNNRQLSGPEKAVLNDMYGKALILQNFLVKHGGDYSHCVAWVKGLMADMEKARELSGKSGIGFIKKQAEAILEKFNIAEMERIYEK